MKHAVSLHSSVDADRLSIWNALFPKKPVLAATQTMQKSQSLIFIFHDFKQHLKSYGVIH